MAYTDPAFPTYTWTIWTRQEQHVGTATTFAWRVRQKVGNGGYTDLASGAGAASQTIAKAQALMALEATKKSLLNAAEPWVEQ